MNLALTALIAAGALRAIPVEGRVVSRTPSTLFLFILRHVSPMDCCRSSLSRAGRVT
jgi:hypothetical protein